MESLRTTKRRSCRYSGKFLIEPVVVNAICCLVPHILFLFNTATNRAHLPKTLADLSFEHVQERVPDQYIKNAIASCLASKMVYKEGTKFIEAQTPEKLAAIALKYVEKEREVATLMESLAGVEMPAEEKEKIIQLLEAGGARTALALS